jgi:polyhydroxyalkanoate synthase
LEEWANEGESLPYPAAKELIEAMFREDLPGTGGWRVCGEPINDKLAMPSLHLVAEHDRIAPAATTPAGEQVMISSGHVGMIVGSARERLHETLRHFIGSEQ